MMVECSAVQSLRVKHAGLFDVNATATAYAIRVLCCCTLHHTGADDVYPGCMNVACPAGPTLSQSQCSLPKVPAVGDFSRVVDAYMQSLCALPFFLCVKECLGSHIRMLALSVALCATLTDWLLQASCCEPCIYAFSVQKPRESFASASFV
jgi:hypothetical protein